MYQRHERSAKTMLKKLLEDVAVNKKRQPLT